MTAAATEGIAAAAKAEELFNECKALRKENQKLAEVSVLVLLFLLLLLLPSSFLIFFFRSPIFSLQDYQTERTLRKKYYNQIEDMKGKIRVYCRARPLSGSEKERGAVVEIILIALRLFFIYAYLLLIYLLIC